MENEEKEKKPLKERLANRFARVCRFFTKPKVVTVNCIISVVLSYIATYLFIHPSAFLAAANYNFGSEFASLRAKIKAEGVQEYDSMGYSGMLHSDDLAALDFKDKENKTFTVAVGKSMANADYFEYDYFVEDNGKYYDFMFQANHQSTTLFIEPELAEGYTECPFAFNVYLANADGSIYVDKTIDEKGRESTSAISYFCLLREDFSFKHIGVRMDANIYSAEEIEQYRVAFVALAEKYIDRLPDLMTISGITRQKEFIHDAAVIVKHRISTVIYPVIGAVLSILLIPYFALTLFSAYICFKQGKKARLLKYGVINEDGEFLEPFVKESEKQKPAPARQPRGAGFEAFLDKRGIKPFLGEWFFRASGLLMILIANIFLLLSNHASGANQVVYQNMAGTFGAIEEIGAFILVIAIVQIVSETRRNLHISAFFFFTLANLYYFFVSGLLYFLDTYIMLPGIQVTQFIMPTLPGNIFLGMGIFAILGFFLFHNPPKWIINRKFFRGLSLLPILLAIASIVLTLLIRLGVVRLSYGITNFLFIRDFATVFVGICLELEIFFFQVSFNKTYGEDSDKMQNRPIVQFAKNTLLCGLVVLYVILFYLTPSTVREALGIGYANTFLWLTIPFFLFYRPAKEKHGTLSSIIYYVLYVIAYFAPKLLQFIM